MPKSSANDVLQLTNVRHVEERDSPSLSGSSSSNSTPRARDARVQGLGVSLLSSKLLKPSFAPPTEDNPEEEMANEIKRSRHSHDCNLSALSLTSTPSGLPLTTLTKLCLSENKLTSLPEELFAGGNGRCLIELDVNSNDLQTLPVSLFFLQNLEALMLNHNKLTRLPDAVTGDVSWSTHNAFLPALRRVGLEFNELKDFPMCFFKYSPKLVEVLLGQNEDILESEVFLTALQASPIHDAWAKGRRSEKVILRLDNRPRLTQQVQKEDWAHAVPWVELSLHKIYPDKVLDFLYLGSMRTAQTVSVYRDLDIGFVLTVGRDLDVLIEPGMQHKVLLIDDYPGADITTVFTEAFHFIDEARAAKKGILIHCFAGLSRSVTIAAAYIMKTRCMTRDEAMALIKEARPAAQPNEGFLRSLKTNEKRLMDGEF